MKVKDPGTAATKWSTRAAAAQTDYTTGAQGADQATPAAAAVATWQAAVNDPTSAKRFVMGIQAAGNAGWLAGIQQKGAARYAQGVGTAAAKTKYQTKVTPYFQALQGLTLPPRGLRRSAQNFARVQAVDQALAAVKTGSTGG